jgi:hypothetical protein
MGLSRAVHDALVRVVNVERHVDPYFRPGFDRLFRPALQQLVQAGINVRRRDLHLGLAQEQPLPDEEALADAIVEAMSAYLRTHWPPGQVERAGNTKTYGVVRGTLVVGEDVPPELRVGVFARPHSFRAWVRFAGPGPGAPPDIEDNGILSLGVKLVGVDGPKLLDETGTQDFTFISSPTFTTATLRENLALQEALGRGTPLWFFLNLREPHLGDLLMQGLYARTHTSPLETRYWSTTPFLLGEGRAVQLSVWPTVKHRTPVPFRPPDDYLREALARRLESEPVELVLAVQVQVDAHRMPVEDAHVVWPERLSPYVPIARLQLPVQRFDSPAQLAFARNLSYNPWHCLPEHRPLGNQNRARRHIYLALSQLRQELDGTPHIEPTGDETFD